MTMEFVRSPSKVPLRLIDENINIFRFFRFFGLFPISYDNGEFIVHEKMCVISRILWFLWHLTGMATILYIQKGIYNPCYEDLKKISTIIENGETSSIESVNGISDCDKEHGELYSYAMFLFGIFMFILIDPVQTIILKRTLNCMANILKHVKHLESITFGNQSPANYSVSKIYPINNEKKDLNDKQCSISSESTTNICINEDLEFDTTTPQISDVNDGDKIKKSLTFSKCYNILRFIILGLSLLLCLIVFGITFYYAVRPQDNDKINDIKDEWKFFGCLFYLVFPVLTTWFCVFFLGYERKMYKVLNELSDDLFVHEEHFKDIGNYLETIHHISDMLAEHIYRFTFGINFALFVMIGTMCMYELIQGVWQLEKSSTTQFGDIIYIFPLAICVFHLFISCEHGTNLVHDEHELLEYKIKGILTSHMVDDIEMYEENPKKLKRVEVLYTKFENLHPYVTIYGGFRVDYKLFAGVILFMFGYSRIINKDTK